MDQEDLKQRLMDTPSMDDFDWIKKEIQMLYKLSGKTKQDRANNRMLFTILGTMLILVQMASAIIKIFK